MDPQETSSPAPADDLAQLPGPVADHLRARDAAVSAQAGGDGDGRAASAKSGDQTTTDPPAGQQDDDPVAKLTPEQRARVLAESDPDEYAKVNDRFDGYVGKRLQVKRAEDNDTANKQALLGLRQRAAQGDGEAAVQYAQATSTADLEAQHQAAWSEAVEVFQALDANPATKPIVASLAGRDYGALAGGNGTLAAMLYRADLAQCVVEHLPAWEKTIRAEAEAEAEKKLRPVIEREIRAKYEGEEPPPDAGAGAAPGSGHRFTVAEVERMSPDEFRRHEAEIMRQMARNPHVGRARAGAA